MSVTFSRDGLYMGTIVEWGVEQVTDRGLRHRLSGRLSTSARGPILETDDGRIWALDLQAGDEQFIGKSVLIEGVQAGLDRIRVEWVGLSNDV
jgi:Protein of unknown function (DUF5818)